ncbi:hypothetical protein FHR83_004036 [Actinoplanes campanulatus]|uniref:Uncharacterized protein n=1 Tax=Actinoplanes campanulatus TaxID=113559 RepID=A0A7W5AHV8_9ACTN|nr:hypothetical protein [Actinoplanes campanulatus]MBB3096366.1 hypothetical protein [Actinoplanes campanulatus]GGN18736.1 hypothetical protein GCM10010109_32030 [Actinoplanes campanulatus]GID38433.1 hypothetical protein Aca09nite_49390 [Actinoplanes campanulatus]
MLERVAGMPGVQPLRVFPVLLPMWAVEIRTVVLDAQPYEVFDQYVSRAVAGAGLREPSRLAAFFGVEVGLIERAVRFLESVGHLRGDGAGVVLTELGRRSVADGCRYVLKEDRQVVYLDGFTCEPLPKSHYAGTEWCDEPSLRLADRTAFHPVTASPAFRVGAIQELADRPDRERFNLPGALTSVEPLEAWQAWLPAYIVECVSELLVFIKAVDGPDRHLGKIVTPYLSEVLAAEPRVDDMQVWLTWLEAKGLPGARIRRMPNRVLRAGLPAAVFGQAVRWAQLGSFEVRQQTFMQLWCEDVAARRQAVLVRAAAITGAGGVRRRAEVEQRLADLAGQLEVAAPGWDDLYRYAEEADDRALLDRLNVLASG